MTRPVSGSALIRLALPFALIALVLFGAWLIWWQPEPGAPAANLQVVLGPGASVRVRYVGSGVGNVGFRCDGATIGGDGLEGGRSLTQVVPPGRVTVEFDFPRREERVRQELDLAPGETREVGFRQPGAK